MGTPMTALQPDDFRPVRLGDYVGAIPEADFGGHDFSANDVQRVYREPTGRWVIVDEPRQAILGHHLLNLNLVYGVEDGSR